MLGNKPNEVYDPFLKAGLGYKNPERLKKAIAAQPKMYDGERLHSAKLTIDSPDLEETLKDAEESRLKMRNKMVQINCGKLNALYETFVPQQEFSVEQTYFSIPSTSNNGFESKEVASDLPIPKMPKESVRSFNNVRRPKSKDTKSKDRVLKNNNDKRPSAHVRKMSSSVSIDSNKHETMHSNMCFLLSHEKCVARYALSRNSSVKRALFTTPIAAKSKNLGATSVVTKSKLSDAKITTTTNKVIQLFLWIVDSECSKHMTGNLQLS
ncbi:hypothetical protein Tco_0300571 [Tanacetum coccineum]